MPTEAFFKLDENKKQQIMDAAVKEFSTLPYAKVSVFKIAQHAGVSRSGFYYYFKDKKDVYVYILDMIRDDFLEEYKLTGNPEIELFQLAENIFDYIADLKGTDREPLFRRIVADITPENLKEFMVTDCCDETMGNKISIDMTNLKAISVQELKGVVFLLATSIIYSVSQYFEDEATLEEGKNKLYQMFKIIKHGISI